MILPLAIVVGTYLLGPQLQADDVPIRCRLKASEPKYGSSAAAVGGCRITADSVTCWDPEGRPNEHLRQLVLKKLKGQRSRLMFPFPGPALYGVVRGKTWFSRGMYAEPAVGLMVPSALDGPINDDPELALVQADVDASSRTLDIPVWLSEIANGPVNLKMESGSSATLGSVEISFVGPSAAPFDVNRASVWVNRWAFKLALSQPLGRQGMSFIPVGKDGNPILAVNDLGQPVRTDPQWLKDWKWPAGVHPNDTRQEMLRNDRRDEERGLIGYTTNIDPRFIDHFRLDQIRFGKVLITGIPSAPRRLKNQG